MVTMTMAMTIMRRMLMIQWASCEESIFCLAGLLLEFMASLLLTDDLTLGGMEDHDCGGRREKCMH